LCNAVERVRMMQERKGGKVHWTLIAI
jgi:hypothetical protein